MECLECWSSFQRKLMRIRKEQNSALYWYQSKLLQSMINDLLDFSLISKGKFRLNFEITNVTAVIEETVSILSLQAHMKGLVLQIRNNLYDIRENHVVDGNRIKQVLLNLIGNAIKFTKHGCISVAIKEEVIDTESNDHSPLGELFKERTEPMPLQYEEFKENEDFISGREIVPSFLNRKRLIFEVEDTGVGIKPSNLSKLFKLFSRVSDEDGDNKNGIGLGLAISQSLVCLMNNNRKGGHIMVESEYGKGSKFSFPLYVYKQPSTVFNEFIVPEEKKPLAFKTKGFNNFSRIEELPFTINTNASDDKSPLIQSTKRLRVLIVDDDPINLLVAKSYLGSSNDRFLYSTVTNGKEAIDIVLSSMKNDTYFDLILMDCNMPIMDGYEASRILKSMMASKTIPPSPIIAITANVGNNDKEKCLKNGMDHFLTKPFSKQRLLDTIDDVLSWKDISKGF